MPQTMRDVRIIAPMSAGFENLRMTNAAEGDLDQNLAGLQGRGFKLNEFQRLAKLLNDRAATMQQLSSLNRQVKQKAELIMRIRRERKGTGGGNSEDSGPAGS